MTVIRGKQLSEIHNMLSANTYCYWRRDRLQVCSFIPEKDYKQNSEESKPETQKLFFYFMEISTG